MESGVRVESVTGAARLGGEACVVEADELLEYPGLKARVDERKRAAASTKAEKAWAPSSPSTSSTTSATAASADATVVEVSHDGIEVLGRESRIQKTMGFQVQASRCMVEQISVFHRWHGSARGRANR